MRPELFRIPLPDWSWLPADSLPVRGYGVMLALGFLTAILVAAWRARREGENPDHIYNLGILALVGGIVGARLFDVIEYAEKVRDGVVMYHDWTRGLNIFDGMSFPWLLIGAVAGAALYLLGVLPGPRTGRRAQTIATAAWSIGLALVAGRLSYVFSARDAAFAAGQPLPYSGFIEALRVDSGGLTVYGGLILATLLCGTYIAWMRHARRINPLKILDILAPSLALGIAFGRMGCFLNGCCYGAPCSLPWAITWAPGTIPHDVGGLHGPIHPAQLYGVLNGLLLFAVLHLAYRWKRRHGLLFGAFFGLYAISRFLLEMLRLDEAKVYLGGLSISQAVGIFVLAGTIIYCLWVWRSPMSDLLWQPARAPAAPANGSARSRRKNGGRNR